jgi:transcriptional regulator with XRE-family HTH domain
MVNIDEFILRLETILDYYGLNASSFADKIGVQRSSMSHLLSGRNKPSLDFVMKIAEIFPEVDLYWLLNNKGTFPKSLEIIQENENDTSAANDLPKSSSAPSQELHLPLNTIFSSDATSNKIIKKTDEKSEITLNEQIPGSKEVDKIVLLYTDGTFKIYTP